MRKDTVEEPNYSPFWACLLVFVVLAVDGALRFNALMEQRRQLAESPLARPENVAQLSKMSFERGQIESRLQSLSMDLIQVATTNNAARQIVQEFNIQWTPPSSPSPTNQVKP